MISKITRSISKNANFDQKFTKCKIYYDYFSNRNVFKKNTLIEQDKDIKALIEKNERSRVKKKLLDIQKQRGSHTTKSIKNIEKEEYKPFHFSIESFGYKDTICERLQKQERRSKIEKDALTSSFYKSIHRNNSIRAKE